MLATRSARLTATPSRATPALRRAPLAPRASAATSAGGSATAAPVVPEAALDTLRRAAARPGSVRPSDVLSALVAVEKAKLKPDGWDAALTAPGTRWRLIFTVPGKDITAAAKGQKGGTGGYFPLAACQKFDETGFENGVFLGPVGHLTFKGPFQMDARLTHFDVDTMYLGLGPWRLPLKLKKQVPLQELDRKAFKALPFFVYAYVGPDIVVARGRSGGVALWGRADSDWLASSGAMQVYK
ncbi:hypothetical protein GPECTOR_35g939 [Gonium pectorale]|uniref:Plastid lipid-associated protein/fibrillin conserved domain-containing protein n=1 Tax=Gonium pectorale TaxID=33097 RepID=A0A150GCC4_GONPE|nr:hypothetical protein GPECTOR_35g939 [Gonium pectorale]|eukprot:KXZ47501.1 hypothetical protein GPECTOR_35g939 [Gonium pectorale]